MTNKLRLFLALGAILLAAPAAADTQQSRSNVRGMEASAGWYQSDACTETSVNLWAFDQADRSTSGQPVYTQEVHAYAYHYDYCTGRSFEAFGSAATQLEFDGLDSAIVEIPVQMTWSCEDLPDGSRSCDHELETATLTAAFTGTGEETYEKGTSFFENGSIRVLDRYNATRRPCEVSGSLVLAGTEMLGNLMDAGLFDIRQGRHLVTRD